MLLNRLVGLACTSVFEHYPENFTFKFGNPPEELSLAVDCLWRIISNRQVQCTSLDHGHQYGLPEPIDAYAEAHKHLCGKRVVAVHFKSGPSDLTLEFETGCVLELLQEHAGYEPWNLQGAGIHSIALGSGEIADFSSEQGR
jgi:hypothetical protein